MRKIDKAFSNSLKAPGNVIPIQDVLLVRIEPLARYRPHAILAVRDNAYLSRGIVLRGWARSASNATAESGLVNSIILGRRSRAEFRA
jgi:hypothetical protein